jgi:hypothetical protein
LAKIGFRDPKTSAGGKSSLIDFSAKDAGIFVLSYVLLSIRAIKNAGKGGLRMKVIFSEKLEAGEGKRTAFRCRSGAGKGRGFSLIEVLTAMIIAFAVIGATIMLMGRGFDVVGTNSTYSQIQNAALSSFEFLPKEIGYVDRVDIVQNASTAPTAENKWRYIAAVDGRVTEIYWDEDAGAVRQNPLAGSINIASLRFSPKSKSTEKGTDVYREVFVRIETKDKYSSRNVVLERSIQVRADLGVTDENGDPATETLAGPVLRFKGDETPVPVLELFRARGTKPLDLRLNMDSPDMCTWWGTVPDLPSTQKPIYPPVKYDLDAQFDAVLMFDKPVELEEDPIFTWLVTDRDEFYRRLTTADSSILSSADFGALSSRERSEKLLKALQHNWLDLDPTGEMENLWKNLNSGKSRVRENLETVDPFRKNASYLQDSIRHGYRVVEVSTGATVNLSGALPLAAMAYRVIRSDVNGKDDDPIPAEAARHPRFQWGKAVYDNVTQKHDIFDDAFIIGLVRYRRSGEDDPEFIAAAFRLEENLKDELWDKIMDIAEALEAKKSEKLGNGEFGNMHGDFNNSEVRVEKRGNEAVNYGRGRFSVAAAHSVGSRGSQMMTTLSDKYFRHLSEDLYGVTNYSLYIDKRLLPRISDNTYNKGDFMPDGGLGVLLNGSSVETAYITNRNNNVYRENFSSGYMFEWDPGAAGMTIRFNHYSSSTPRPEPEALNNHVAPEFFDNDSWVMWGVHPLYAYIASKAWPAPGDYGGFQTVGPTKGELVAGATKRAYSAPAQIAFFPYAREDPRSLDVIVEDFEDHVSPPPSMVEKVVEPTRWVGWGVYYRPPFVPRVDGERGKSNDPPLPHGAGNKDQKDYRNGAHDINYSTGSNAARTYGPVPMRIFSRGRNNIGLNHWNRDLNGWSAKEKDEKGKPIDRKDTELWFGGTFGTSWGPGGVASVYAFWHPQTWHLYENMQWEWRQLASASRRVKKDFIYGGGDYRSGWRFDIEYQLTQNINSKTYDFATALPKEWTRRHILKLTVLEVTRNIYADEVEEEWRKKIHHEDYDDNNLSAALQKYGSGEIIHKEGDMFVRAELIQLKRGTDDGLRNGNVDIDGLSTSDSTYNNYAATMPTSSSPAVEASIKKARGLEDDWIYDSRNWVYSKPLWYGKFRGDGWRGRGDPKDPKDRTHWSLFKRMGMSMMHLVTDPEPKGGDAQSFRGVVHGETTPNDVIRGKSSGGKIAPGRGVRVRSWKDHFRGWNFSDDPEENKKAAREVNYSYEKDLEKLRKGYNGSPRDVLHPDLTFADDELLHSGKTKKDAPLIDKLEDLRPKHRLNGVWTPPAEIDLNGWGLFRKESLDPSNPNANPGYSNLPDGSSPRYGEGEDFANTEVYQWQSMKSPGGFQNDVHKVYQWGPTQDAVQIFDTFGQYAYMGQEAEYERRLASPAEKFEAAQKNKRKAAVYKFGYNGKYTDMLYVRLSLLRPDYLASNGYDFAVPEELSREPVWGLYAIRAWDYQRGIMGRDSDVDNYIYDYQQFLRNQKGFGIYDNVGEARKRLLMVVQGLQLTYQPHRQTVDKKGNFKTPKETRRVISNGGFYLRAPKDNSSQHHGAKKSYSKYNKNRERIFGLHFWGNDRSKNSAKGKGDENVSYDANPNKHEINEVWIGEGFSPIEVVEILGLDRIQFDPSTALGIEKIAEVYSTK